MLILSSESDFELRVTVCVATAWTRPYAAMSRPQERATAARQRAGSDLEARARRLESARIVFQTYKKVGTI